MENEKNNTPIRKTFEALNYIDIYNGKLSTNKKCNKQNFCNF